MPMNAIFRNLKRLAQALLILTVAFNFSGPIASAESQVQSDFLSILNAERTGLGKNPLTYNASLTTAAYLHSQDMAENNYFSHTSLDGRTFVQRIVAAGYTNYLSLGENIAYHSGSADAAQVYSMWKNSPGHYANMMGDFNEAGLGVYSQSGLTYYTLDLGKSSVPIHTPPVLAHIGNQSVTAGQPLRVVISATDADGYVLIYSASNLPTGAGFNAGIRTLAWTPTSVQVGTYPGVHFQVSDGTLTASEDITITVLSATPWNVNADGAVNVLDMISVSQHWGETGIPGWIRQDVNTDGLINTLDLIIIGQHWTG